MNTEPKALRLSDLIDHGSTSTQIERETAAELRRLHEENKLLHERHSFNNKEFVRLHSVNAVLLKALEEAKEKLEWFTDSYPSDLAVSTDEFFSTITKAITKAQE